MSLILSRPKKLSHSDTVLYEIYMLRFAAGRLLDGHTKDYWRDEKDAWVYLEAFLVHFRNLIEFLGNDKPRPTDVHVKTIWKLEDLTPPGPLDDICAKGTHLWDEYEPGGKDGVRLSQYLAHCTQQRIEPRDWDIDRMTGQIEPLLAEIEKRLPLTNETLKREPPARFAGPFPASVTTATITASAVKLL